MFAIINNFSEMSAQLMMFIADALQMRFVPNYDDALVNIAIAKYLSNVKNVKGGRA